MEKTKGKRGKNRKEAPRKRRICPRDVGLPFKAALRVVAFYLRTENGKLFRAPSSQTRGDRERNWQDARQSYARQETVCQKTQDNQTSERIVGEGDTESEKRARRRAWDAWDGDHHPSAGIAQAQTEKTEKTEGGGGDACAAAFAVCGVRNGEGILAVVVRAFVSVQTAAVCAVKERERGCAAEGFVEVGVAFAFVQAAAGAAVAVSTAVVAVVAEVCYWGVCA